MIAGRRSGQSGPEGTVNIKPSGSVFAYALILVMLGGPAVVSKFASGHVTLVTLLAVLGVAFAAVIVLHVRSKVVLCSEGIWVKDIRRTRSWEWREISDVQLGRSMLRFLRCVWLTPVSGDPVPLIPTTRFTTRRGRDRLFDAESTIDEWWSEGRNR
jgi:hypothetical protein